MLAVLLVELAQAQAPLANAILDERRPGQPASCRLGDGDASMRNVMYNGKPLDAKVVYLLSSALPIEGEDMALHRDWVPHGRGMSGR